MARTKAIFVINFEFSFSGEYQVAWQPVCESWQYVRKNTMQFWYFPWCYL